MAKNVHTILPTADTKLHTTRGVFHHYNPCVISLFHHHVTSRLPRLVIQLASSTTTNNRPSIQRIRC
jgi:hypothetical protein